MGPVVRYRKRQLVQGAARYRPEEAMVKMTTAKTARRPLKGPRLLKTAPESSKKAPRRPLNGPRRSKMRPKRVREDPKTAPRTSPGRYPNAHFKVFDPGGSQETARGFDGPRRRRGLCGCPSQDASGNLLRLRHYNISVAWLKGAHPPQSHPRLAGLAVLAADRRGCSEIPRRDPRQRRIPLLLLAGACSPGLLRVIRMMARRATARR